MNTLVFNQYASTHHANDWTNVDKDVWHSMTPQGRNESIELIYPEEAVTSNFSLRTSYFTYLILLVDGDNVWYI